MFVFNDVKKEYRERLERVPKFLGVPITFLVYIVCAIHLVLSLLILNFLVVGRPINLEGVLVSPVLQWCYGVCTLLLVPSIVLAALGSLYLMELPLRMYANLSLLSATLDFTIFLIFLFLGRNCMSTNVDSPLHFLALMYCGVQDGVTLLSIIAVMLFKLSAVFITQKSGAFVRSEYNENLIPFVQAHLRNMDHAERVNRMQHHIAMRAALRKEGDQKSRAQSADEFVKSWFTAESHEHTFEDHGYNVQDVDMTLAEGMEAVGGALVGHAVHNGGTQ